MDFLSFLNDKPLFYDTIDLERMPTTWQRIRHRVTLPKIIHLIGTNGKGTTGRFLATALLHRGLHVGHYTSPHMLRFNERLWLSGEDASDAMLQSAFETVLQWLTPEEAGALSYFEFTTLMAVALFAPCDCIVMEAGLGGEYDATAAFDKALSVVTPIDFDHQAFLGDTIDAIAGTKLRAMGPLCIVGRQPHAEVYTIARTIAQQRGARVLRAETLLDEDGIMALQMHADALGLPEYLHENLMLAAAAMQVLRLPWSAADFGAPLPGRLSRLAPNVRLDVGHNVLAARSLAQTLGAQRVTLVYNSYGDKDYHAILEALRPNIEYVELIEVHSERAATRQSLIAVLDELQIPWGRFERIEPEREYLVFGSFSVAEAFLKRTGLQFS